MGNVLIVPLLAVSMLCSVWSDPNTLLPEPEPDVSVIAEESPQSFDFTLSFTGDIMVASYMNQTTATNFNGYANTHAPSYFLQNVAPVFEQDDYTIVNLENVLSDNTLTPVEKSSTPAYWYYSKTSNTEILTSASVECVNLSNNHTGDYGVKGQQDTVAAVEAAGLLYGDSNKTLYLEKNGYTVAIICNGLWSEWQANTIVDRIKDAEQYSDFQVVFYHGGTERVHTPEQWRIRASRKLVDNGADLVIGNHPHVLQPIENYNGADIIYSMGNFLMGDERHPENRTIIYQLILTISNEGELEAKSTEIIPCYVHTGEAVNNYCPAVIEDETQKQKVLDFLNWQVGSPV